MDKNLPPKPRLAQLLNPSNAPMKTSTAEFQALLEAPEHETLEFKRAENRFSLDELADYCVGIANASFTGGKIVLGVTDQREREVVGTKAFPDPGEASATLYDWLEHQVNFEEYDHHGKRVLIIHVPGREPSDFWSHRGKPLIRRGAALVPMQKSELRRLILNEDPPDFSANVSEATFDDLSPEAIASFQKLCAKNAENPRLARIEPAELLTGYGLLVDNYATYAALVLFGTQETLRRHLARSEICYEYRSFQNQLQAEARHDYREGFFLHHDKVWEKIDQRNGDQHYQKMFAYLPIKIFDEKSVREAIINAVSHREYRVEGSIFIRHYPRHIEIESPGCLLLGVTPENILNETKSRNSLIAEAFQRTGLVERAGQGIDMIVERAVRRSKPLPDFSKSTDNHVRLVLNGTLTNPHLVRFFNQLEEEGKLNFSTPEFLALHAIANGLPLDTPLKSCLARLLKEGFIERNGKRGRGVRYHLSTAILKTTGHTPLPEPTIATEAAKEAILRHLADCGESGASMSELEELLYNVPRGEVRKILNSLRDDKLVRLEGKTRAARWVLAKPDSAK